MSHATAPFPSKGRGVKYYDVVNEAVCGCITWPGSSFSSCAEYVASEEGKEKCGYRDGLKSGPQVARIFQAS